MLRTETNLYKKDAHLYDLDNRDLLKADIPFYCEFSKGLPDPILELACGTGRVTIPLGEAGHNIWGLELSETMLQVFKEKMNSLPKDISERINLVNGDMSNFKINMKFNLILIPYRSFQVLHEENLQNSCLQSVYNHLSDEGYFIIDIGNFAKIDEKEWEKKEEIFDWENIDPRTGFIVRRTHKKKGINTTKQTVHLKKTYYITKDDGSVEKVFKEVSAKYFFEDQIKNLITSNGFKIIKEMGFYDERPIIEGTEYIFICQKR